MFQVSLHLLLPSCAFLNKFDASITAVSFSRKVCVGGLTPPCSRGFERAFPKSCHMVYIRCFNDCVQRYRWVCNAFNLASQKL